MLKLLTILRRLQCYLREQKRIEREIEEKGIPGYIADGDWNKVHMENYRDCIRELSKR